MTTSCRMENKILMKTVVLDEENDGWLSRGGLGDLSGSFGVA